VRTNSTLRTCGGSSVPYDEAKVFGYALPEMPDETLQRKLLDEASDRYWPKGVWP